MKTDLQSEKEKKTFQTQLSVKSRKLVQFSVSLKVPILKAKHEITEWETELIRPWSISAFRFQLR